MGMKQQNYWKRVAKFFNKVLDEEFTLYHGGFTLKFTNEGLKEYSPVGGWQPNDRELHRLMEGRVMIDKERLK